MCLQEDEVSICLMRSAQIRTVSFENLCLEWKPVGEKKEKAWSGREAKKKKKEQKQMAEKERGRQEQKKKDGLNREKWRQCYCFKVLMLLKLIPLKKFSLLFQCGEESYMLSSRDRN